MCFLFLTVSCQLVAQISTAAVAADSATAAEPVHSGGAAAEPTQQGPELPQPGQPGSPFPVDHFWNHISLELAGGYSPVVNRGTGYYGPGFTATVGAVYQLNSRWAILAEGQVLGQHGGDYLYGCDSSSQDCATDGDASYIFSFQLSPLIYLRPHSTTSPFLVGGAGYYHLGTHEVCDSGSTSCPSSSANPFNSDDISVNAAGFSAGAGVRHQISQYKKSEIYVDARYNHIASGGSALGQVSVLPISVGVRW